MTNDSPLPHGHGLTVYQAAPDYADDLARELAHMGVRVLARRDPLFVAQGPPADAAWAQNVWLETTVARVASIGEAARTLRAVQRNWSAVPVGHYRRVALIAEKLPPVSARPLVFGASAPSAPLGAFTLWDEHTLIASPRCASPFADGAPRFVEDTVNPPNRAYLKLWEALTLLPERPAPGQLCLDLGGSPGGWAYVLQSLGARVFCEAAVHPAPIRAFASTRPRSIRALPACPWSRRARAAPLRWSLTWPERWTGSSRT